MIDTKMAAVLRDLEKNEDLRNGIDTTPEQDRWEFEGYAAVKPWMGMHSKGDIPFSAVAIVGRSRSGRFLPLSPDEPIQPVEKVQAVTLHRVRAANWHGHNQRRRFRWNFQLHRFRPATDGTGVLWVDSQNDDEGRIWQHDAAKEPLQDHPKFELCSYNPQGLLGAIVSPDVPAPWAGKFELSSRQRHVDLLVGGAIAYRFSARDAEALESHLSSPALPAHGDQVEKGQTLVRLTAGCQYGRARLCEHTGKPWIDKIGGDVISASREPHKVLLAAIMLNRVGMLAREDLDVPMRRPEQWLPRHLVTMPPARFEKLSLRRDLPAPLRSAVLEGLRTQTFQALSPARPARLLTTEEQPYYLELRYTDGGSQYLPKTARLLPHIQPGTELPAESAIADWVPELPEDWEAFVATCPQYPFIAKEYLRQRAIRPGTGGHRGSHLLVPSFLLPGDLTEDAEHYVDLRPLQDYFFESGDHAWFIGPPIYWPDAADWYLWAGGVGYNLHPRGDKFCQHELSPEPASSQRHPKSMA